MNREDAAELNELLEYSENSAGGMMTTEYVALPSSADVRSARDLIAAIPDLPENFHSIYLVEEDGRFSGTVPVSKLVVASAHEKLVELKSQPLLSISAEESNDEVIDLMDKYNLLTLPVLDPEHHLIGMITADDVISVLRKRT
jgi:magnesium transporter